MNQTTIGPASTAVRDGNGEEARDRAMIASYLRTTDDPEDPGPREVAHLRQLGIFSDAELLAMWTDATARAIFPDRQVGRLEPGFEASFLALDANPADDIANVGCIRVRWKQGLEISS